MEENETNNQENLSNPPEERESLVPKPQMNDKRRKILRLGIIIVPVTLLVFGFVWLFFLRGKGETVVQIENQDVGVPTEFPTPTMEPIDRSEATIQILNASGIAGEATYLQGVFADLGYKDIEIGNADERGREVTNVTYSSSLSRSVRDEVSERLNELYETVREKDSESTEYDIEILLGLRKGQSLPTATPTQKPKPTATTSPAATPSATPTP